MIREPHVARQHRPGAGAPGPTKSALSMSGCRAMRQAVRLCSIQMATTSRPYATAKPDGLPPVARTR